MTIFVMRMMIPDHRQSDSVGEVMKKIYARPTLEKRDRLSLVTANAGGTAPGGGPPKGGGGGGGQLN
ncbi:hypothetical protein [Phreatobacter sp.]|uniref:hypothetical protein n=1 Tax=Phreatobacter sp. TaxID=1966341 RepID=UPI003F6F2064